MMELKLETTRGRRTLITIFHRWDVNPDDIVKVKDCTPEDAGRYLDFEDGSGWLVPIINVYEYTIRTTLCVVKKADYVCKANIHGPNMAYTGAPKSEEHPYVVPYNAYEKRLADFALSGKYTPKRWTARLRMLTLSKLREEAATRGLTEKYFIDKLMLEAEREKGTIGDRLKAIAILGRIMGVELDKKESHGGSRQPLFGNVSITTIQDDRRTQAQVVDFEELPAPKEMTNITDSVSKVFNNAKESE